MINLAFLTNKFLNRNAKFSFITFCLVINSCGDTSQTLNPQALANLNKTYPSQAGGTFIDATIGEPSGLIYMVAGESAAGSISANIFNKLLKYDKNLELEG